MEHMLIPVARVPVIKEAISELRKRTNCKISMEDGNSIAIDGEPYDEYNAKNILQAMARGFKLSAALKLLTENYFFESIDIGDIAPNKEKLKRIKARVIGTDGKAKLYMESVSGAAIEISGDTISIIGNIEEIRVAKAGINILLDGGKHNTAYMVMEKERRKLKDE